MGNDAELEAIKAPVNQVEEESAKLNKPQPEVNRQLSSGSGASVATINPSFDQKLETDSKSVFIGNVDYSATAAQLEDHFQGCGRIKRVTILCNKFNGTPKGFAYIEFADKDSVETAKALDESLFRGRQIKVMPKRTNKPGMSSMNLTLRGRGLRGRVAFGARGSGFGAHFGAHGRPMYRNRTAYFGPY